MTFFKLGRIFIYKIIKMCLMFNIYFIMPIFQNLRLCNSKTLSNYSAQILHILSLFFILYIICLCGLNLPHLNCYQLFCFNLVLLSILALFRKKVLYIIELLPIKPNV